MTDSIIFDLDGTLWDSTDIVAGAWNCVIAEETDLDLRLTSRDLKNLFGRLLPDIAAVIFSDETKERQLELMDLCCQEEHRALLRNPGALYKGLEDMLKILSENHRLFIVSNCQAGYIEVFLKSTGLARYFEGHLCPGDTGKAKASNIRTIVDTFHLKSPVYVGDTAGDFQAAVEAGLPFIFASYGFGKVDHPDGIITCPMELVHCIDDF